MKRLTAYLTAAAMAAVAVLAADATTANPRVDPSRVKPQRQIHPQPQIKRRLTVADCSPHFTKQNLPGKSYNCHFTFRPVCRNGTVLGPVNMKKIRGGYRVTYTCYEPPR